MPYRKPPKRPEPVLNPPPTDGNLQIHGEAAYEDACATEVLYNLLRSGKLHEVRGHDVPPWAQYHMKVSDGNRTHSVSNITFNPIIMAPPNDPATVYTTLLRFKEAASALGHSVVPACFDMGLLTKALEIVWSHQNELSGVIPIEGGMHFLMSVFSGIGFLYGDAGLRQLLQDSGVFAVGTTQQILAGRDFDRAVYSLKLTDEVLNSRFLMNFQKWCEEKGIVIPNEVCALLESATDLVTVTEPVTHPNVITKTMDSIKLNILPLIQQFRIEGRSVSPTFRFWDDFLTKVMLPLKIYLASTKKAIWAAHQASKYELLKLLFASNRTNYARYMPVLLLLMQQLPDEVKAAFECDQVETV